MGTKRERMYRVDTIAYDDGASDWYYIDCPWDFISASFEDARKQFEGMCQPTAYGALELAREQLKDVEFAIDGIEFVLNEVEEDGVTALMTRDFPIGKLRG